MDPDSQVQALVSPRKKVANPEITNTYTKIVARLQAMAKLDLQSATAIPQYPLNANSIEIALDCKLADMNDQWEQINTKLNTMISKKKVENSQEKTNTVKAEKRLLQVGLIPEIKFDNQDNNVITLQAKLDSINQRIAETQLIIDQTEQENGQLHEEVAKLPSPPVAPEIDLGPAKHNVATLEKEITKIEGERLLRMSKYQKVVDSLRAECDRLDAQVASTIQRIDYHNHFFSPKARNSKVPRISLVTRASAPPVKRKPSHLPALVPTHSPNEPMSNRYGRPKRLSPIEQTEKGPVVQSARNGPVKVAPPSGQPSGVPRPARITPPVQAAPPPAEEARVPTPEPVKVEPPKAEAEPVPEPGDSGSEYEYESD